MKKVLASILITMTLILFVPASKARAEFTEDTDDTFAIVWLSDTQDMSFRKYGGAMAKMGKWIAENRERLDMRYVVQTGDAVENGAAPKQWQEFETMYNQFKNDIPYIGVAGNHEVKKNGYLEYLTQPEVLAIPVSQRFRGGESSYTTLEADGCKLIIVGIGYGVEKESAPWVEQVLQEHADYTALLLIHDNLTHSQKFGITGKWVFENLVSKCPNIRLVLSGHVCDTSARQDPIDDNGDGKPDRVVTQMMYDYQHYKEKCGQLRILQFNTKTHSITVTTYSPVTNRYYRDYWFGNQSTFTLDHAF
ncbi:MAG: metallophosphoesterase [Clostridiaceae bacterium]